jgi:HSP20 family protein
MLIPNVPNDGRYGLAVDVEATPDEYVVRANVPDMRPEDLHLEIQENTVTVRGQFQEESRQQGDILVLERHSAQFSRTVTLPEPVDPNKAQAVVENGVLTLRLPRAEQAQPKAIAVIARFS